jgi:uncharacterized sulfatase
MKTQSGMIRRVLLLGLLGFFLPTLIASSRPNVIFILGDDQAWWDYSFMRQGGAEADAIALAPSIYPVANTPAIDRLANEGLAFVQGYGPVSLCRPSLMAMATGTYPHQHRVTGNDFVGAGSTSINDSYMESRVTIMQSLPRILAKRLGYVSFQTGKWWEGDYANGGFTFGDTRNSTSSSMRPSQWAPTSIPGYAPARHGDWGLMIGRVDYVNGVQNPILPKLDPVVGPQVPGAVPYANTVTPVTDFIDAQVAANQPFLVWYAPFLPHTPHDPPAGLLAKYDDLITEPNETGNYFAKYYANIERLDGGVGAILDHLDSKGITGNTIVVFIGDNGWINNTNASSYAPKSKQSPYDGGVRTPILVYWPDKIKPGGAIQPQVIKTPASTIDLVPTVLSALGLEASPEVRGINLLDPVAVAARDALFGEIYQHNVENVDNPVQTLKWRWVRRDGWKLILPQPGFGSVELYHLYNQATGAPVDPFETNNLAATETARVGDLSAAITQWYDENKGLEWRKAVSQSSATALRSLGNGKGQTWTPTSDPGLLAAIDVVLKPTVPGRSLTLEVRELVSGEPTGALLASSALPAEDFVPNEIRWYQFPFVDRIPLTPGMEIGFRLLPASSSGGFEVAYASGSYAGGRMVYDGLIDTHPSSDGAFDLAFDVSLSNYATGSQIEIRNDGASVHLEGLMNVKQQPAKLFSSPDLSIWTMEAADQNLDGLSVWDVAINQPKEFFRIRVGGAGDPFTIAPPPNGPVYNENFTNGTGVALQNVIPDITTAGGRWTADASFKDNGSVTGVAAATAYLPFIPENGHSYHLSVVIQQTATDADNWLSFGFLSNSTSTGSFSGNGVIWALTRNLSGNDNQVLHQNSSGGTGSVDRGNYVTGAGTVTMSLVLDTTGGSGNWKYDWIVNGSPKITNRALGSAFESSIGRVGIGRINAPDHSFRSLTLTTD